MWLGVLGEELDVLHLTHLSHLVLRTERTPHRGRVLFSRFFTAFNCCHVTEYGLERGVAFRFIYTQTLFMPSLDFLQVFLFLHVSFFFKVKLDIGF